MLHTYVTYIKQVMSMTAKHQKRYLDGSHAFIYLPENPNLEDDPPPPK